MKLISSTDTLSFLSKAAPRPWVKRMLLWMIYNDDLRPYFRSGSIKSLVYVLDYLKGIDGLDQINLIDHYDDLIRENYDQEVADKIVGRKAMDKVEEGCVSWTEDEEPHAVGAGFFIYSEQIDWEVGTLHTEVIPSSRDRDEHLFWDEEEHLQSEFDDPDFIVNLCGLCFELDAIEMLLPNVDLQTSDLRIVTVSEHRGVGRPRKWDWEGAMADIIAKAQHPDGLPTGPGAQARIEEMMTEWFISASGDSPAMSQIRQRAQIIVGKLSPANN